MNFINHPFYPSIVSLVGDKMSIEYIHSVVEHKKIDIQLPQLKDIVAYIKPIVNEEKKRIESLKPRFILSRKGDFIFEGSENECFIKLQRSQSQSADWAMKYEGYTITPKTV